MTFLYIVMGFIVILGLFMFCLGKDEEEEVDTLLTLPWVEEM